MAKELKGGPCATDCPPAANQTEMPEFCAKACFVVALYVRVHMYLPTYLPTEVRMYHLSLTSYYVHVPTTRLN